MFGLIIPKGELGMRLMEKLEDMVTGIMLPAFFWTNGLKVDLIDLSKKVNIFVLFVVLIFACSSKIISAFIFSMFQGMSTREGIALGVLMNTKGVLALIVLNSGRDFVVFFSFLITDTASDLIALT